MQLGAFVSGSIAASRLLFCACEPRTLRRMRYLYTLDTSRNGCSVGTIPVVAARSPCRVAHFTISVVVVVVAILNQLHQVLFLATAHNDAR
jgi:hypothetical protein